MIGILARDGVHHIDWLASRPSLLALRSPAFLPDALFETQIGWWVAAIVTGAALLLAARQRSDVRLLRAGQLVLAAALLWIIAAQSLDTTGERLYKTHQALATATENKDVEAIMRALDPSFSVDGGEIGSINIGRGNAREGLGEIMKTYAPREIHITAYRIIPLPDGKALTHLIVIANVTDVGPTKSYWRLTWRDVPGEDWRLMLLAPDAPGQTTVP